MTAQEKITRPRPIFPSNMLSTTQRLINTQRISVITAIAAFIASGFISYLVCQNPRWQLYTLVLASTFLTIASIATVILARYEKHWSIWLLILTGQVVFLIAAIVITGSGLVSLISIISLSVLVAILCLPDNQSRIAISIALLK